MKPASSEPSVEPISVEMCLAGRDLSEPKLSPDGSTVTVVVRWGGAAAIVSIPAGGGPERLVTTAPDPAPGRGLGGGCYDWVPDGSAIVYVSRAGELWLHPLHGGAPRRLADPGTGRRFDAPVVAPDGATVAVTVDQAEIWSVNVDSGGTRRLDAADADFVFDPAWSPDGSTVAWTAWNVPAMPWDRARVITARPDGTGHEAVTPPASIQQPRFHPDGRPMAVRDDHGWRNVWLGGAPLVDEPVEHAGPTWGQGNRSYAVSPDGRRVAFTRNERGFARLCVTGVDAGKVDEVARGVHGQLTWAGGRLAALRTGARTPTQLVVYDTDTWERTVLAVGPVAGWDAVALPEPELVEVDRDGVTLHARRYVAGSGRTLCWVHGGPTDQWQVEFMPRVAYWWSRGYDILVPDPRGTSGHGRAYEQALQGEWGRLDVDDTAAILAASHERGWSTPDRTAMIGSSSGGLTVLGVLGRHHGLAAGGVTLYPVADLAVLADESHRFEAHYTIGLVGPLDDTETYRSRSPVEYASAIEVPVLLMHGDADPVVPLSSTIRLADAIRSAGGDVELAVMEGEGHGFRDPANKRADYELTGAFLDRVLAASADQ